MCLKQDPLISFITGVHIVSTFIIFTIDFPLLIDKVKDIGLENIWAGIILGTFSIPSLTLAFIFNKFAHKFGRKCIYIHGLLWQFGGSILFGLIEYIDNKVAFLVVAFICRLAIGFGAFQTKTIIFSIAGKKYPSNVAKIYSFVFIGINFGIGAGPFLGSLLYDPLGQNLFLTHLIVVAAIALIFLPTAFVMLKTKQDQKETKAADNNKSLGLKRIQTTVQEKVVPYCKVLKNFKTISLYFILFIHVFYQHFWTGRLSDQFKDVYGQGNTLIAFTFLLRSLCLIPFSFVAPIMIAKCGRIITVFFGCVLHLLGFFIFGPPTWFGDIIENGHIYIIVSVAIKGAADPFLFIPLYGQIIEDFQKRFIVYKRFFGAVSDVVSSFGNLVIEFAVITSIIFSTIPKSSNDYRVMGDICFWAQVPIFLFFLVFSGVIKSFKECKSKWGKVKPEKGEENIKVVERKHHNREGSQGDLIVNNENGGQINVFDQIQQSKFSQHFSAIQKQNDPQNLEEGDDELNGNNDSIKYNDSRVEILQDK